MKVFVILLALSSVLVACSSAPRVSAKRSVAIAIVMANGARPSPEEVASVHVAVRPDVERHGYVIAANPRSADYVMHVKFTPDQFGGSGGRVSILEINPSVVDHGRAMAARDQFKEQSARAVRSQIYEPR